MISLYISFFFNAPAPTEIYTLSLHDALPISDACRSAPQRMDGDALDDSVDRAAGEGVVGADAVVLRGVQRDRKSTRLNSSHSQISYAVFCLKKKKKKKKKTQQEKYNTKMKCS